MLRPRYLTRAISEDALAKRKIAFVSGPRQVGKSTLARSLLTSELNYYLYDEPGFRRAWARSAEEALASRTLGPVVLDEIHKDRKWKTKLKGLYDKSGRDIPIIVTGSARLDLYRKGSDSLLGRYLPYRLHPFTVAETATPASPKHVLDHSQVSYPLEDLLVLGGFPEPLLGGREKEARRWSRLRIDRLVVEDSRDILNISDANAFRTLIEILPERVGSLLSINALYEDVGKAYATVRSWLQVLDALYFSFTIRPYAGKLARTLKAEPKLYLFDILRIPVEDIGRRLENLTALHLLKACQFWTDTAQGDFELRFVRTRDGWEVDFLVLEEGRPWMLIECKTGEKEPSKQLRRFGEMLKPKYQLQLVHGKGAYRRDYPAFGVTVLDYETFFAGLL
jgi:uncharacterized protein